MDSCMGYQHCARCGELLGDSLGGCFTADISLGCGCPECQENYAALRWRDRFLVKRPEWLGIPDWREAKDAELEQITAELAERNRANRVR